MEAISKIDDYLLGRKLGTGQFSKVKEGLNNKGDRFAIKYMLKTNTFGVDESYRKLVMNEANIMSQFDHENLVKLYYQSENGIYYKKSGKQAPVLYLVFDLITGGELFDYVAVSGRFSDKMARYYFKQFISALEYMHNKGFAHRDIKCENVLLDSAFNLKLADFGFSAPLHGKDSSGKLHTYKGTPGYMAPEILAHSSYFGEKVDIFSAGVLLFTIVAQHPPFKKANPKEGYYKMLLENNDNYWKIMSSSSPVGTYSPELKDLLNKLLALNPANRPTIENIKNHAWMTGPLPTQAEIQAEFTRRRAFVERSWKEEAEKAIALKKLKEASENKKKAAMGGFASHTATRAVGDHSKEESKRKLEDYKPVICEQTILFTIDDPEETFSKVSQCLLDENFECLKSDTKYKITGKLENEDGEMSINVRIQKVNQDVNCIRFERVTGDKMEFLGHFNKMKTNLTESGALIN